MIYGKPSSGGSLDTMTSTDPATNREKADIKPRPGLETEDDLMDFLMDENNF
jgi:hypothetical protein